jgi:hypothetical protein
LLSSQLQAPPFYPDPALAAFAAGQKRQSASDFVRYSLEQQQQLLNQLGGSYAGLMSGTAQTQVPNSAFAQASTGGPASAAMASSMPATAAMNAAAASGKSSNLFESTPNLKSLVNEQHQQQAGQAKRAVNGGSLSNRVASQNLLNRLPSSGTIFPENLSSASLSHLLQGNALSSNRLSSMLSLSGYLSREPSLVDLLIAQGANGGQFPPGMGVLQPGMPASAEDAKRYGHFPTVREG